MVDCRHVLDKIPHYFTSGMISLPHKLAPIDHVVHQPWFVSVGSLEKPQSYEDVVGRLRDNDEGGERRLVSTDGAQTTLLVVDPRLVEGLAAHVGQFKSKGLE